MADHHTVNDIITPAEEVRSRDYVQKNHLARVEDTVRKVMMDINRASAAGKTRVLYDPRPDYELYDELILEFERCGYTFRPVGEVGGAVQKDLYICW